MTIEQFIKKYGTHSVSLTLKHLSHNSSEAVQKDVATIANDLLEAFEELRARSKD